MIRSIWVLLLVKIVLCADKAFYTKLRQSPNDNYKCLILDQNNLQKFKGFQTFDTKELKIFMKSAISAPADMMLTTEDDSKIIEIYAKSLLVLETYIDTICKSTEFVPMSSTRKQQSRQAPEIERIVNGGDKSNRIDVVFMGDGYTADERDQFFDDIGRLTDDMFNGDTFRSYLPLFNIWALYVESNESGIGYDGPKDTAFRLYRRAGQLRGVFTDNAQYARELCQQMGPSGCDYPSIIGNDDYYGGLEGEFVISTKSNRTGTVVLRHEMGHNFVDVGEEYDNGNSYFGVNSAPTLSQVTTKWGHWLSGEVLREERVTYRLLAYPWANLSLVSAAGETDSLEFILDGAILPWASRGSDDREFYDWRGDVGFSAGEHSFSVRSKTQSTNPDIPRMICSITIHEFGNEDEFRIDNNFVSAYPTWDVNRQVTYRPTNAGCLMRNMTNNEFCPVCKEGMWYQFLQRISLIDDVSVSEDANPDRTKRVNVNTLKLGQFREPGKEVENEKMEIRWSHEGQERPEFDNQFEIDAEDGAWSVSVRFYTPEVRLDPNGLLQDVANFTVTSSSSGSDILQHSTVCNILICITTLAYVMLQDKTKFHL